MSQASAAPAHEPQQGRVALSQWIRDHPWIWSFAAALVTWAAVGIIARQGLLGTLTSTLGLVPFLILAGLGQMMVITLGNGHIDLSLPNTITLCAYVSTGVMGGGSGSLLLGFLVPLLIGVLVAAVNSFVILGLKVPPIVATLSVGLMIQTAMLVYSGQMTSPVNPALVDFTRYRIFGLPLLGLLSIVIAIAVGFVLYRTTFGRSVQAIGQKLRAAELTGLRVNTVIVSSYVVASLAAAIAGVLLGAYSTPNLDLGAQYLLNSIAVVVLGGSLVAGGKSNVAGIWGSSLFLLFLLTLLGVMGAGVAVQNIVKGALIIVVLLLVGGKRRE